MKQREKIWDLRLPERGRSTIKIKAQKGLGGFLVLMLVFTILSRAANAMTIPQVTVEKAAKRTVSHSVKTEGTIQAGSEQAVSVLSGLKIKTVYAVVGQHVEAGEALLELDSQYLSQELRKLEIEAEKLTLQITEKEHNQALQDDQQARTAARAEEDYNLTAQSENIKVDNAYREMIDAYNNLINAANAVADETETQESDSAALQEDYQQKQGVYNEAVAARDQALIEKERAITDANTESEQDSTAKSARLDKEAADLKIAEYQKLQEQDGVITSPCKGVVSALDDMAVTGGITPETGVMRIADSEKGYKFTTQITKAEKKYLSVGDEVTLISDDNQEINQVKIASITKNSEDEAVMDVVADVGADDTLQLFDALTMQVSDNSKAYNTTISADALHQGANGESDYVLVIIEQESVLGTQLAAQKIEVTVLDSNEQVVAVSEAELSSDQEIIVSADKEIKAGDRIRLAEDNE